MSDGEFTKVENNHYLVKKVGRPTKYDYEKYKELFEKYKEEYSQENYLKLEKSHSESRRENKDGSFSENESYTYDRKLYIKVPNRSSFARYIGLKSTTQLDDYEKKYPEFKCIIKELKEFQKDFILDGASSGRINPLIAKLLLSKHGIVEVKKVEHSGSIENESDFKNLSTEELLARRKKIENKLKENEKKVGQEENKD